MRVGCKSGESDSGLISSPATPTHNLHWKCLRMKVFVCCASSEYNQLPAATLFSAPLLWGSPAFLGVGAESTGEGLVPQP